MNDPGRLSLEVDSGFNTFHQTEFAGLLVVPTCQRSEMDLVQMGEKVEDEKDRLLRRFMAFAKEVCSVLQLEGHWADYIDPCSGLPMINRSSGSVYDEVEALSTLRGFKTQNAGCCKILLHPKWQSCIYPATLFTKAPLAVLQAAIGEAEKALMSFTD